MVAMDIKGNKITQYLDSFASHFDHYILKMMYHITCELKRENDKQEQINKLYSINAQ
jgi:hypothetical protein